MKVAQRTFVLAMTAILLIASAQAQNDGVSSDNLFDLSLEELMNVPVVSASRIPTAINKLSAAVTVITAEDIRYSGLKSIPEILQFAPGVDVRRMDRQRYIVGVRGLFGQISDRTLVLIDGRPAMDPITCETHWINMPVMIEDIERIEIVRGPSSAAWGANAFNGVINIITKKPEKTPGGFLSTTVSEFGDSWTHLRYGHTQDPWSLRVSAGYENVEDSDAAGAGKYASGMPAFNPLMGFDSYSARDWGRIWKFDTRAQYSISEQTTLSFGAAHSSGQQGDYELVGNFPRRDYLISYTRDFVRLEHQFDDDTNAYVQWFTDYSNSHRRNFADHMTYLQNDIEGQLSFKPAESHTFSVGGNLRWNHLKTHGYGTTNQILYSNEEDEYWAGLFLIDRWSATEKLTLEGQLRLDHYSATSTDWSTRLTALYALDQQQKHILRTSFARSFRSPALSMRESQSSFLMGLLNILPMTTELHNEGTYSLETGYRGQLSDSLSIDTTAYYQRYEHLIGTYNQYLGPIINSTFAHTGGANAHGAEIALNYQHKLGKLSAWYAYNALNTDHFNQVIRALEPARHKTGLTGRLYLDKNWTLNTNYVFQGSLFDSQGSENEIAIQNTHRLDLTLSRKFAKGSGEMTLGVTDLLDDTNDPFNDIGTGLFTALETPGRMFFARLQLTF